MNREFILITKGILPVSVLTLLAIALIAGQSGVGLAYAERNASAGTEASNPHQQVEWQDAREATGSAPIKVESIVTMPYELDLHALIPKGSINTEILTNRKLNSH